MNRVGCRSPLRRYMLQAEPHGFENTSIPAIPCGARWLLQVNRVVICHETSQQEPRGPEKRPFRAACEQPPIPNLEQQDCKKSQPDDVPLAPPSCLCQDVAELFGIDHADPCLHA